MLFFLYSFHFFFILFQCGDTPLHLAVRHCHRSTVACLLNFVFTKKSRQEGIMLVNERQSVSMTENFD